MKYLIVLRETLWFRCHPITGPVDADDPTPTIYFSWREAFDLAWKCVIEWQR